MQDWSRADARRGRLQRRRKRMKMMKRRRRRKIRGQSWGEPCGPMWSKEVQKAHTQTTLPNL